MPSRTVRIGVTPLEESLGENHDALARDFVLLEECTEDPLAIAYDVSCGSS